MSAAVQLLQNERQCHAVCRVDWFFQLKDRLMRLTHLRIDAPCCLRVPVERVRDGPAALVEVRNRLVQGNCSGLTVASRREQLELRQMQVAVVLTTGAVLE